MSTVLLVSVYIKKKKKKRKKEAFCTSSHANRRSRNLVEKFKIKLTKHFKNQISDFKSVCLIFSTCWDKICLEKASLFKMIQTPNLHVTWMRVLSVEGFNLTPPRYSQHEYERFDVNTMTYQAARAACRHIGSHLDMPVLTPAEIHYRWPGIIRWERKGFKRLLFVVPLSKFMSLF